MQKITPFLWFDGRVEEAAKFYASVFKDAKIESSSPMSATFRLHGLKFIAFNGGPYFKFNEAVSFFVNCKNQAEVDELWEKLSEGGSKGQCGWLKDKFGVSWQIIPSILIKMLNDEDDAKAERVRNAMLQMHKIDIAALKKAYREPAAQKTK